MDELRVCQLLALMSKNQPRGRFEKKPELRIVSTADRPPEKLWAGTRPDPVGVRMPAAIRGSR